MKKWWSKFKKKIDKYMINLEDEGYTSPIFLLYLLWELTRIAFLAGIIYGVYTILKIGIKWYLKL
jgi:hypothetical protein